MNRGMVPDGCKPGFHSSAGGGKRLCRRAGSLYFGEAFDVEAFGWAELVPLHVGQGLSVLGLEQANDLALGVWCGGVAELVSNDVADLDCLC